MIENENSQLVTSCIVHLADSANFEDVTSNKLCSGLTGSCFESPNDTIHENRSARFAPLIVPNSIRAMRGLRSKPCPTKTYTEYEILRIALMLLYAMLGRLPAVMKNTCAKKNEEKTCPF